MAARIFILYEISVDYLCNILWRLKNLKNLPYHTNDYSYIQNFLNFHNLLWDRSPGALDTTIDAKHRGLVWPKASHWQSNCSADSSLIGDIPW